jgi:hypothetical protein
MAERNAPKALSALFAGPQALQLNSLRRELMARTKSLVSSLSDSQLSCLWFSS